MCHICNPVKPTNFQSPTFIAVGHVLHYTRVSVFLTSCFLPSVASLCCSWLCLKRHLAMMIYFFAEPFAVQTKNLNRTTTQLHFCFWLFLFTFWIQFPLQPFTYSTLDGELPIELQWGVMALKSTTKL